MSAYDAGTRNQPEAPHVLHAPPPPASDAPQTLKDAYWMQWVYRGDSMPQLTIRAVLLGGILGSMMSISNLYTVLKVGWLFGVAITACVMSYVIWNTIRVFSFGRLSQMSILENACMASTASAAGYSTGSTIGTMFGAMLLIKGRETGANVENLSIAPWWIVAAFTLCTGALGVFLAIPMKRQMINNERLPFPSGIAAAQTLRSLYSAGNEAIKQAIALLAALGSGVLIGLINTGKDTYANVAGSPDRVPSLLRWVDTKVFGRVPELVPEHGFAQVNSAGTFVNAIQPDGALDPAKGKMLQGFGFEPSGLLIAAGMIMGLRTCLSILGGAIILFFFLGPWLVSQDTVSAGLEGYLPSIKPNGSGTVWRFTDWSLWGGTAMMLTASLAALALQWRTVVRSFNIFKRSEPGGVDTADVEVPMSWFIVGLIPISIALIAVSVVGFSIHWYWGVAAVALSFALSLVASRATGETDTTPIGAMGKVMQLVFGAVQPGQILPNLASAGIAANGASASADLLTDLKTGYELGANPRRQFVAQFIGIFFGTAAIVPAWYLMVPDVEAMQRYPAPSTQQWVAVAELLTKGVENLPHSARWAIVICGIVGAALPVLSQLAPARLKAYVPSPMGLGLAFLIPFANSLNFAIGAVIAWVWMLASRSTSEKYTIPVASGLIAGEGLIKAIIAITSTLVGLGVLSRAAP